MGVGGVEIVAGDQVEEPVGRLRLAGEGDGLQDGSAEPRVADFGVDGVQGLEGFEGVGLGDGHGGLGGGIVLKRQELRGPADGGLAFEREDAGVAGSQQLGLVVGHQRGAYPRIGGQLGMQAQQEGRGVGAHLLDGADGVEADGRLPVG